MTSVFDYIFNIGGNKGHRVVLGVKKDMEVVVHKSVQDSDLSSCPSKRNGKPTNRQKPERLHLPHRKTNK